MPATMGLYGTCLDKIGITNLKILEDFGCIKVEHDEADDTPGDDAESGKLLV